MSKPSKSFDDFPDMTLPERTEPALPPPVPMALVPREIPSTAPLGQDAARHQRPEMGHAAGRDLPTGTRVWAEHSSQVHRINGGSYVGTVQETDERHARICFDDGAEAWIELDRIMPLVLGVGLRIMGRWKMHSYWFPGTIGEIREERLFIRYDDGDREWTTTAALMLPAQMPQPGEPLFSPVPGSGATPPWMQTPARTSHENHNSQVSGWLTWGAVVVGVFILRLWLRS